MDEIAIEHRLSDVEARAKSNTRRIDSLERITDEIHSLAESVAQLVVELKHTNETLADHEGRLSSMENEARERLSHVWKAVVTGIVSALAGAAAGILISGGGGF